MEKFPERRTKPFSSREEMREFEIAAFPIKLLDILIRSAENTLRKSLISSPPEEKVAMLLDKLISLNFYRDNITLLEGKIEAAYNQELFELVSHVAILIDQLGGEFYFS